MSDSLHILWTITSQATVHGILQARILERVAMPSSRRSSQPRDQTHISYVSCIGRWILYHSRHLGSPTLLVVMPSKAHLTSHSRMSGSGRVTTAWWLSVLLRSFLYSSSVYSFHLFFISSASVRPLPFLSLIVFRYIAKGNRGQASWSFILPSVLTDLLFCFNCEVLFLYSMIICLSNKAQKNTLLRWETEKRWDTKSQGNVLPELWV